MSTILNALKQVEEQIRNEAERRAADGAAAAADPSKTRVDLPAPPKAGASADTEEMMKFYSGLIDALTRIQTRMQDEMEQGLAEARGARDELAAAVGRVAGPTAPAGRGAAPGTRAARRRPRRRQRAARRAARPDRGAQETLRRRHRNQRPTVPGRGRRPERPHPAGTVGAARVSAPRRRARGRRGPTPPGPSSHSPPKPAPNWPFPSQPCATTSHGTWPPVQEEFARRAAAQGAVQSDLVQARALLAAVQADSANSGPSAARRMTWPRKPARTRRHGPDDGGTQGRHGPHDRRVQAGSGEAGGRKAPPNRASPKHPRSRAPTPRRWSCCRDGSRTPAPPTRTLRAPWPRCRRTSRGNPTRSEWSFSGATPNWTRRTRPLPRHSRRSPR